MVSGKKPWKNPKKRIRVRLSVRARVWVQDFFP